MRQRFQSFKEDLCTQQNYRTKRKKKLKAILTKRNNKVITKKEMIKFVLLLCIIWQFGEPFQVGHFKTN